MKLTKRLLILCVAAILVCSMLVLSSCGLFRSDVENAIYDLRDATTVTMTSGNYVYKIDLENYMAYYKYTPDSDNPFGKESENYIYKAEDGKFYMASKSENTIRKQEISKNEFVSYFSSVSSFTSEFDGFLKMIDFFTEEDGKFTLTETEDGETATVSFYVDDDGNLVGSETYSADGETETESRIFSAINETEVVIPEDIKTAEAEALE